MKNFNYNKVLENLLSNPDIVEIAMAIQEYKGKQELLNPLYYYNFIEIYTLLA